MAAWESPGETRHTATFVAHPLACTAALATLDTLESEDLVARARSLGADLAARLAPWERRFAAVLQVRGRGLLWGVELTSREQAQAFSTAALDRGVLVLAGGADGRVAQIVPPLNIAREQLDSALTLLESALADLT